MHLLKQLVSILLFVLLSKVLMAQCTTLGQRPTTAFPVCGTTPFVQNTVPTCNNGGIPVPGCDLTGAGYSDQNPFWYKFTCYASGTFAFTITPKDLTDDYDWQLFDITGHNPDEVYTNASLFVIGNWAGTYGLTGASSTGSGVVQCGSFPPDNVPTFSVEPQLLSGHQYLLMISHYSGDNQSGYTLAFTGGTASIIDPVNPALVSAEASCDAHQLKVKLNKKMKCSSLIANGSEFSVPGPVSVLSAVGVGCTAGFDMDSVILNLSDSLAPGNHTLIIKNGTDGNTLSDNCDRQIPDSSTIPFVVFGRQPTPLDSMSPVGCNPRVIQLVFSKNIRCNSIAANGSDFYVTGTYPVNVTAASGVCSNALTTYINVQLSSSLPTTGIFTIHLQKGTDGNTLIDECGEETLLPASLDFSVKDTVSADFTYIITEGCTTDQVDFFTNGGNGITSFNWTFDTALTSILQDPSLTYTTFGNRTAQLIVTNGFCSDTTLQNLLLPHDSLLAAFNGPALYCPNEVAVFTDSSAGNIISWYWEFGNGHTSTLQNPPAQTYYTADREKLFPVRLIIGSNKNCADTALQYLKVVHNCFIAVPSAFTPNNDGKNDYLYPLNAYKATQLSFRVYNKYGQLLYVTSDWSKKWDGSFNGFKQPSGVYVWMLQYTDATGKKIFTKGTSVLIR